MSLTLFALIAGAEAGELVLHGGDPAAAQAALGEVFPDADLASYELRSVPEWLAGKPVTLTAGSFEVCEKAPARPWTDALAAAVKPIDEDLDFEAAKPFLEEARASLLCADAPIDGKLAAKIEYLRGITAHFAKDGDTAKAAFARALTLDPEYAWDAAYPPSAKTRFEEARQALKASKTSLAILPRTVPVRIDGKAVELVNGKVDVMDGTHVVQVGGDKPVTLRVTFDGVGAASLAVPGAVPADATAWAADPLLAGDLARLAALYTPGIPLYAVAAGEVYQGGNNALGFAHVAPPEKKGGRVVAMALMGGGGAAFVGGAGLALAGLGIGNAAVAAGEDAQTFADWEDAEAKYQSGRGLMLAGWGVAAAGAAVAAAGGALFVDDVAFAPMWTPGGAGVAVRVGGAR